MIQANQLVNYAWKAIITDIHDGDTITVQFQVKKTRMKNQDIGFRVSVINGWICYKTSIRFYGINAPELATQEGKDALAFLQTMLTVGQMITIKTYTSPTDKYGRWLGELYLNNGQCVNDIMVATGHAVPYFG